MDQATTALRIRRVRGGEPILAPAGESWERGVTFNAAVVLLGQSPTDRDLSRRLLRAARAEGSDQQDLVAVLYRARPRSDPGYLLNRSRAGLALFDSEMKLVHRFPKPVLEPDSQTEADDYLGVEDPRITRIGERFVMVYCGCGFEAPKDWRGTLCVAESSDLLKWEKRGAMAIVYAAPDRGKGFDQTYFDNLSAVQGAGGHVNNKDGALFPDPVDGWHYLLHRPMVGPISSWAIHLARSRSVYGQWEDLGPIMRALPKPDYVDAWIGAGAPPLSLGDERYLEIYHCGHRAAHGTRLYTLGAAVLDMKRLEPNDPKRIIESRLDHFLSPQTHWEVEGPYPDSVGNVVFTCGAFEREGRIFIIYGGGDTYIMAASVDKAELLTALDARAAAG